jgi:hypothetical protein
MWRHGNIGSFLRRDGPLDRTTAWICLLTNQFVTPGLGSILAGRIWSGLAQVTLAGAGFCFVMAWFFNLLKVLWSGLEGVEGLPAHAWKAKLGLLLFLAGWLLALITSLRIVRSAQRVKRPTVPPRL